MAVSEEQHVARDGADAFDHPRGARGNVVERLATDDAVAEERPSGPLLAGSRRSSLPSYSP